MGLDSPSHWLILAVVVVVLFGYKKLPEMSRSVGRSLRIFKTEMKGMGEDDSARAETPADGSVVQPVVQAAPVNPVSPAVPAGPANAVPVVPVAAVPVAAVPVNPVADPSAPPVSIVKTPAPAAEAPREAPQQQVQG
ncbi:MAG: Sec-independent protein translocase subunit TatA [Jatrophihabitans sp.]